MQEETWEFQISTKEKTLNSKKYSNSYEGESVSHSVVFDFLPPHGLQPARLLCPWNTLGKNTGVGSHSLLQGIFPTQGSNQFPALQADSLLSEPPRKPQIAIDHYINNTYLILSFQNKRIYKIYVCKTYYKHRVECKYP